MKKFYEPTQEHLSRLSDPWCASYSGGKDSTSLVLWVEWLRRSGWIDVQRPQLVQSDTGVEEVGLMEISLAMMTELRKTGWQCVIVEPAIHEKLYNRILGIGNSPIHPGIRRMRWCTRSTKIDPMDRWRAVNSQGVTLTGLRFGESAMRDGKIKKSGCAAGGECGMPDQSERTYSPILRWTVCHVIDWLSGLVAAKIQEQMADLFAISKKLIEIYDVKIDKEGFDFVEPKVTAARFGCIGCPAIGAERLPPRSVISRNGLDSPLNEIYDVWYEARLPQNRCFKTTKKLPGPIRLEARKRLFDRVIDIQNRACVKLINIHDEAFIRQCWKEKRYPRGWSEADESTPAPSQTTLFI